MNDKVNIRVYKRGYRGTILLWNVDPLTSEQRQNVTVLVRSQNDQGWAPAATEMPDVQRMVKAKDENNDTIMVLHNDVITQHTSFDVKLVFGKGETGYQETSYHVSPSNTHRPFTKPSRIVTDGKTVYAESVSIVHIEDTVIDRIAQKIKSLF